MTAYAPLARYVAAATLVRVADGGATAGLVLLAIAALGDAGAGGLLAACLTAPHLLGPWVARRLDAARDGRRVLAAAFAVYAIALAAATQLVARVPLVAAAAATAAAGACGPLLTGGLSSRLASMASDSAEHRAEGWDAVTYGVGGTVGPAAVGAIAGVASARAALVALAGAALLAAALTLTLPRTAAASRADGPALTVRETLRAFIAHGPLRRVSLVTLLTALALGALPVVGVVLGAELGGQPGAGAAVVAAFGLGNLAASLLVTAFPLRGEPEMLTSRWAVGLAAAVGLCAVAPSYPLALAAFAAAGAANAPLFTATLAARSRYSSERARAQVFVSIAGAKVAMISAGTALAGAAVAAGPRGALAAGALIALTAAAVAAIDRRVSRRRPRSRRATEDPRARGARTGTRPATCPGRAGHG